jgi:hypothetical protein
VEKYLNDVAHFFLVSTATLQLQKINRNKEKRISIIVLFKTFTNDLRREEFTLKRISFVYLLQGFCFVVMEVM